MPRLPYTDVTGDLDTWPRVAAHAPWIEGLAARGFRPLLAMQSHAGLEWSVTVDASEHTAVSVLISQKTPHLYAVTCLEDGSVLETEWRPTWRFLWPLGPTLWLNDRPARRWRKLARRGDVNALLDAHAALLDWHTRRSPSMGWTVESYLQFRASSRRIGQITWGAGQTLALRIVMTFDVAVAVGLLLTRASWTLAGVVIVTYLLCRNLLLARLAEWTGAMIGKNLSLPRREKLADARRAVEEDDA